MKINYRIILISLVVLGFVCTNAKPEWKQNENEKYKFLDLCNFTVSLDVGHFIQLKSCNKRKIELKQVDCRENGKEGRNFPCYKGSDVIEVRANFPAILNATLNNSESDENKLKEFNLYWENGVNTLQGNGEWEELRLCLEAWDVDIYKYPVGTIEAGEITIGVKPPEDIEKEKDTEETSQKDVGDEKANKISEKTSEKISPEAFLIPRSSMSVRPDVTPSNFVGTWTGRTHDKPDEGTTYNTMVLHILEPSKSDWKASVSGTFPLKGRQEINKIQILDNKIGFYMPASDGKTIVWLGLHPTKDDRLIGESFALEDGCDGRNIELTRQKEKKANKQSSNNASSRRWYQRWDFLN